MRVWAVQTPFSRNTLTKEEGMKEAPISILVTKDSLLVTVYVDGENSAVYFPTAELELENVDLRIVKVDGADGEWRLEAWPAKKAETSS
jgi:hypothetical protein